MSNEQIGSSWESGKQIHICLTLMKTKVGDRQMKTEIGNRQWAIGNTPYALGNNRQYMEFRVVPPDSRWQSRAVGSLAIANSL